MTASLKSLFQSMDGNAVITPIVFLSVFHMTFPRFAEKSQDNRLIQHDAAECWTSLMRSLQQDLKCEVSSGCGDDSDAAKKCQSLIEQYFEGQFEVTMKNTG